MKTDRIRIGTRASKLALWQAHWVAAQLESRGADVEIVHVTTDGDVSSQSLRQVGGQGVFTKAIQRITHFCDIRLRNRVDCNLHNWPGLANGREPVDVR